MAEIKYWQTAEGSCSAQIQRDSKNPMSFEPCGRAAKGDVDGRPLCGIHLRSASRNIAATEKRNV